MPQSCSHSCRQFLTIIQTLVHTESENAPLLRRRRLRHVTDDPAPLLQKIADLLEDVRVLDFDHACAERFGKVRGTLLRQGISIPTADLMIGAVALVHDLTLVTNNTADFKNIPGLRLDDWLTS